ncbi:sensor histidine kinase [uncultured Lactobacillus sp.]|uniref:sensor histidine kinase n=1 Tax=uncultured Lactobacillus sp. TaxID=153152 RepID=UPI00260A6EB3|nr:histidine kinase [uncultured Lactobacillus sp.]
MKNLSLHKLMKLFVAIFSGIIILAAAVYTATTINNFNSENAQIQSSAANRVSIELQKNTLITRYIADYISENTERINNIEEYLKNNPSQYAQYTLSHQPYFNWPYTSKDFFIKNSNLTELQVRMIDSNNAFKATIENTSGNVVNIKKNNIDDMLYSSIINPQQENVVGIVGTKFNNSALKQSLSQLEDNRHMQVWALTDDDRPVFQYFDNGVSTKERKLVKKAIDRKHLSEIPGFLGTVRTVDNQYKVLVVFDNQAMKEIMMRRISVILAIAAIVLLALFASFMAIFNHYRKQLNLIISTIHAVSENDAEASIDTTDSRFEDLTILSDSINHMLDEINNNINTIYKLRIAQQEAHMKALQAQISPHFMANTLEYIRMSALDIGASDLAKVVYNFAALLRSNVSSQVQTTLKKEAKLVGNYVYLYQVRFPDKLAYQIVIPKELEQVKLPKFSLQPLVENYFVHGVNFAQNTNALEVKAYLKNNRVVIEVIDNGRQLSKAELSKLNEKIKQPIVSDKSIGLQNVYARMKNYTKNFAMKISNNPYGGITVRLSFDYEI